MPLVDASPTTRHLRDNNCFVLDVDTLKAFADEQGNPGGGGGGRNSKTLVPRATMEYGRARFGGVVVKVLYSSPNLACAAPAGFFGPGVPISRVLL